VDVDDGCTGAVSIHRSTGDLLRRVGYGGVYLFGGLRTHYRRGDDHFVHLLDIIAEKMISIQQLEALPLFYRTTIPESYLDAMGHMNVRWYMAVFDEAAWKFFASVGMDQTYYENHHGGGFALKQFVRYLAEVRAGETVAVRTRVLGRSAKRIHFMHFMISETAQRLAATLEVLGSHADLRAQRTSPYPPQIAARIDALLAEHRQLDWEAPVCGVIHP
jgi:acyl-CoA thioester hydrolase